MENNKDIYFAPVVIPTLCRSQHFIRLVESLKQNSWAKYTDIYVGLDYPPSDKYRTGWQEICYYIDHGDFSAFSNFTVFRRESNLGSVANIGHLIDYVREKYECWIRTDDDAEFSPNFLEYIDKCLWAYKDDHDVICVSGYSYPLEWVVEEGKNCIKQNFCVSSWGLGFWKKKRDTYASYINSGQMLNDARSVIKKGYHERMTDACFRDYFSAALSLGSQVSLFHMCSDVSLRAYVACQSKYCVFPTVSKVRNHGFDGSGEYCPSTSENGSHALDYDYSSQKIDEADHFDLMADNTLLHMKENRDLMNEFDYRSPKEMKVARHNFKIIKYFGVNFGRFIHACEIALDRLNNRK